MYVCGPTVYSDAHIGHAMSSIVFDFIRRYLEYKGYEVRHVMNFTDVDDKIIARAAKSGEDPADLAHRYAARYQQQLEALNVRTPAAFPARLADHPGDHRTDPGADRQGLCVRDADGDV